MAAPLSTMDELLDACGLASIAPQTDSLTLHAVAAIEQRMELLQFLKSHGVTSLQHRQALTNAVSKARREGRLTPAPLESRRSPAATAPPPTQPAAAAAAIWPSPLPPSPATADKTEPESATSREQHACTTCDHGACARSCQQCLFPICEACDAADGRNAERTVPGPAAAVPAAVPIATPIVLPATSSADGNSADEDAVAFLGATDAADSLTPTPTGGAPVASLAPSPTGSEAASAETERCGACDEGWSSRDARLLKFLDDAGLLGLADALARERLSDLEDLPRVSLLATLKDRGCEKIVERQRFANALSRALKEGTLPLSGCERPDRPPPTCDKCDGKHATDACPYFKKVRTGTPHPTAVVQRPWSNGRGRLALLAPPPAARLLWTRGCSAAYHPLPAPAVLTVHTPTPRVTIHRRAMTTPMRSSVVRRA